MRTGSEPPGRLRRHPTITDIARQAGVSKGTVSYALNGRQGVAPATRERVLAVAAELGWEPSSAARALSGARCEAVGMALARTPDTLAAEPYFMTLVSGIEAQLSARGISLMLKLVASHDEELDTYRRWNGRRSVDGVLVQDLRTDDPRGALLRQLSLPAVLMGITEEPGLPSIQADEASATAEVVRYLVALGHRSLAHVTGLPGLRHTQVRADAFRTACAELDVVHLASVQCDYSGEHGARATRQLLSDPRRPTAVMYDNDVMAVAALSVAQAMGVQVPGDLSVVAWDDSPLCRLTHPALSAVARDTVGYGSRAASLLLEAIEGQAAVGVHIHETPRLVPRGTTAPPSPIRR